VTKIEKRKKKIAKTTKTINIIPVIKRLNTPHPPLI